ncbi:MarR family transcriptional regulator [Streptomyces sp. Je 1-4]|uniref:MarR family winged helix-turn-helix transcriptional regulator n=1 Tax=Streptomyces TaxID=1883 RepID=UPI0021D8A27B|nr:MULTISPECIES: MarR family transcriptional regulator [unclassified Streptomyces]UYB42669.1 MarR family transcriptional regulator [Streptomyces sp. Je 1-4]UZQ38992.1 MarR family transcriptional regulator [Streptomyces sp. Je 1-4] [Streptomyces sp. Je 1-4 4N24]UZQ46409.1 MarR family transcriptional regulator [Streptomyces sp. Je 1-4] [Streptomyces sp. Je 1-4 4N24_ara]
MSVIEGDIERDADGPAGGHAGGDGAGEPTASEDLLYDVIRRLWPLHRTVVRAVERELADTGMTAGEHALLDALHTEGPRTVPQLARTLGLDRQPVQRWVNHAAELGLVVTAPNPAHRRSSLIRLTAEGTAAIRGIQQFEATELRQRLADLPAEDVRTALHVLDRLGEEFRHLANGSRVQPEETDSRGSRDSRGSEGSNGSNGKPEGHDSRPATTPLMHKGRSGA